MAGLSVARRCADARACLARRASQQRTRPTGPRRNQPSRTHPAAFNCDCSLSFFRIALNSELGRPPSAPASNQAVLGSRTEAAASHIRAERNASAMYKFDRAVMAQFCQTDLAVGPSIDEALFIPGLARTSALGFESTWRAYAPTFGRDAPRSGPDSLNDPGLMPRRTPDLE